MHAEQDLLHLAESGLFVSLEFNLAFRLSGRERLSVVPFLPAGM